MTSAIPALELADLHSWHGALPALKGLNLSVAPGQAVSLLCHDDFHRSALIGAILGLADRREGSMRIHGSEAIHLPMERIYALGLGYSHPFPDVLPSLSCEENLLMPSEQGTCLGGGLSLAEIYELFPTLHEVKDHSSASLAAEQRHLLALGRILRTGVNLIMLNKISEHLGPDNLGLLSQAISQLKAQRYTLVLLERTQAYVERLVDQCYALSEGQLFSSEGSLP